MPAAAVIPAPLVYAKVAAVKKFVFGFLVSMSSPSILVCDFLSSLLDAPFGVYSGYREEIGVLKAGVCS